jgi:hypothetical protein
MIKREMISQKNNSKTPSLIANCTGVHAVSLLKDHCRSFSETTELPQICKNPDAALFLHDTARLPMKLHHINSTSRLISSLLIAGYLATSLSGYIVS